MIGAGTEYLYGLIVQLLGRDLVYGLENPSSKKIRSIYEALGVKVAPLEMDEEGIQLDARNLTIPDSIPPFPNRYCNFCEPEIWTFAMGKRIEFPLYYRR